MNNELFRRKGSPFTAVLNFRSQPKDEFGLYAKAFHAAARALVEGLLTAPGFNDLEACPIVFLYRHSLELYLKAIYRYAWKLWRLDNDEQTDLEEDSLTGHQLVPLLEKIKVKLGAESWFWCQGAEDLNGYDELRKLLKNFDKVDSGSFSFRYPIERNGKASLSKNFAFDVRAFSDRMDRLLDYLESASLCIQESVACRAGVQIALDQLSGRD